MNISFFIEGGLGDFEKKYNPASIVVKGKNSVIRSCRILQRGQILCVLMPWQEFCLCKQGFENNIVSVQNNSTALP